VSLGCMLAGIERAGTRRAAGGNRGAAVAAREQQRKLTRSGLSLIAASLSRCRPVSGVPYNCGSARGAPRP
jgi:hypothetical protein